MKQTCFLASAKTSLFSEVLKQTNFLRLALDWLPKGEAAYTELGCTRYTLVMQGIFRAVLQSMNAISVIWTKILALMESWPGNRTHNALCYSQISMPATQEISLSATQEWVWLRLCGDLFWFILRCWRCVCHFKKKKTFWCWHLTFISYAARDIRIAISIGEASTYMI